MRVAELFESSQSRVEHGKVVQIIYALGLKYFKAPTATKEDAKYLIRSTDQFWSSEIDYVTRALQRFINDPSTELEDIYEAVDNAVEEVIQGMREYYLNARNHEPGYKAPKLPAHEYVEVPENEIKKVFADIPGFSAALRAKSKNETEAHLASMTPEVIEKMAALIDKGWTAAYGAKGLAKVAKQPKLYDFEEGFKPATEKELADKVIATRSKSLSALGAIAELALNEVKGVTGAMWKTLKNKKLMAQVAAKSKNLSKYA